MDGIAQGQSTALVTTFPNLDQLYKSGILTLPDSPDYKTYYRSTSMNRAVSLICADITTLRLDAIVNAANTNVRGGGGIDGHIHRAAGPDLLQECIDKYPNGCTTGGAVVTKAYKLPSKAIIHAVGPIYVDEATSEPLLRQCYWRCFELAVAHRYETIGFCCISTGIFGYPPDKAATVACRTVREYLEDNLGMIFTIVFVTFTQADFQIYQRTIP